MDFLNNHSKIYSDEKDKIEIFIKEFLTNQHNKFILFEPSFTALNKILYSEFGAKNILRKYWKHFGGIHNFFEQKLKEYNDYCPDKMKVVLESEVYEAFSNLHLEKYQNEEYEDDFENINYEIFVNELLKYDAYYKISINIDHIKDEIEKKYNSNRIEKIEIFKLIEKNINSNNNVQKQISKVKTEFKENKLSNKEQAFLFYIMCEILSEPDKNNSNPMVPATEIVRLQMLINLYDENIFIGRHGDTLLYQFLNEGFDSLEKDEIESFIEILTVKLKNLKLQKTSIKIKKFYNSYLNSKIIKKINKK
jgi:hypothetical protein